MSLPVSESQSGSGNRSTNYDVNAYSNSSDTGIPINLNDSCAIIEHVLSAIEQRGVNGINHFGGPLTSTEIVKLSILCTKQTEWDNARKEPCLNNNSGPILNEGIGFADVDADMMAQLVEYLEKHVALASQINLVQASYDEIKKVKQKMEGEPRAVYTNIDEVS